MEIETFPALTRAGILHGFSVRSARPLDQLNAELNETFAQAGFPMSRAIHAEQTHGNEVAVVTGERADRVPRVDALITAAIGLPLVIRVADCGAVYFYDPTREVIALAHSGRKGTEANIVGETIAALVQQFGSRPQDLILQLGPCIRPPHYQVDFAANLAFQARAAGVKHFHDEGVCTATHLDRYYSYRAEKGQNGRMWAVLMLTQ